MQFFNFMTKFRKLTKKAEGNKKKNKINITEKVKVS